MPFRISREGFLISDERELLDLGSWHAFLCTSYWCAGIPFETFRRASANSLCVGLYEGSGAGWRMIGAGRVVTDRATYAYLADVFVAAAFRGRGLGAWLVGSILQHPELQGLRRFVLMTRDAHGLYARFGFVPMPDPGRCMERHDPDVYARPGAGARATRPEAP